MSATVTVRPACDSDAAEICDVVRRSIVQLCVADHGNDERILAGWLDNKVPQKVVMWIRADANFAVVAIEAARVIGVALLARRGEVQLCYVAPEASRRGVGAMLLQSLESQAVQWGLERIFLTSTLTAKQFYERAGYVAAEPVEAHGLQRAFPMAKVIAR